MVENQVNCFSWCYVEVYTSHSSTVQCMFDAFNTFTDKREWTKDSDSLSLPKASEMSVLGKSGLSKMLADNVVNEINIRSVGPPC